MLKPLPLKEEVIESPLKGEMSATQTEGSSPLVFNYLLVQNLIIYTKTDCFSTVRLNFVQNFLLSEQHTVNTFNGEQCHIVDLVKKIFKVLGKLACVIVGF